MLINFLVRRNNMNNDIEMGLQFWTGYYFEDDRFKETVKFIPI